MNMMNNQTICNSIVEVLKPHETDKPEIICILDVYYIIQTISNIHDFNVFPSS